MTGDCHRPQDGPMTTTTEWTICPSCQSRWGGRIPKMHTVSCPEAAWNKPGYNDRPKGATP